MSSELLIKYLKEIGFRPNFYKVEEIEFHSFLLYDFQTRLVISICRDKNGNYRSQFGDRFDVFTVVDTSSSKNNIFCDKPSEVWEFILNNNIGNRETLKYFRRNKRLEQILTDII